MPIILSSRLRDLLQRLNDDISRSLLNMNQNSDFVFPFSFLDITDDNSSISFLNVKIFNKLPQDRGCGDLPWTTSSRNNIKTGRIINKIIPFFKQSDVEKWVNIFKAEHKNILSSLNFKIIEGKDIAKYYNGKKYARGNGSLNKSCMRHDNCMEYMKLYVDNPSKIKMVVLFENEDSITGRALLWKLDEPSDTWFMDRIYTREDSDVILFKKYAEKNGWLYKNKQTFDSIDVVKDGVETYVDMRVNLSEGNYNHFPYIDTLQYYDEKNHYVTNSEKDYKSNPYIIRLRETNGNDSGNEFFVKDVVNNDTISIEDAIYCYYGDGYTHKNTAIFLPAYDEYAFPSEVRYSAYQKILLPIYNSVFSRKLNSYIQNSIAVKVFLNKERTSWDYFLADKTDEYTNMNSNYYVNELIIKDSEGRLHFVQDYDLEKKNKEKKLAKELSSSVIDMLNKKTRRKRNI